MSKKKKEKRPYNEKECEKWIKELPDDKKIFLKDVMVAMYMDGADAVLHDVLEMEKEVHGNKGPTKETRQDIGRSSKRARGKRGKT